MKPQATPTAELDELVRTNLLRVRERVAAACERATRPPTEVELVGVTKYVDPTTTAALVRAGCEALGESRPQQLWEKAESRELRESHVRWRLIGHLQRNKVARTLPLVDSIDSVDSPRLLRAIASAAEAAGGEQAVLLEVNISGDAEKHGFSRDALSALLDELPSSPNVRIEGLMTMAAREGGPDVARRNFAELRELRDRLATPDLPLRSLSMGMSGDFELAILEGSTHVRVGSALWEGLSR